MNETTFAFTDADGAEWVRNLDGTFRCLSAEIRSMPIGEVAREFGPLTVTATRKEAS